MSSCERKRALDTEIPLVDQSGGKKSRGSAWKLVVCIIETDDTDVTVREVVFENSDLTDLLDLRKQQLDAEGYIIASLYNKNELVRVYDGVWSASWVEELSSFEESSPPNKEKLLSLWMRQPRDVHEWASYERDMRLIKEFNRFSPYHLSILCEHHDWCMTEENYNYEWETFDWDEMYYGQDSLYTKG